MFSFPKKLSDRLLNTFKSKKKLRQSFRLITGFSPINLDLYKQAMSPSGVSYSNKQGITNSYERLEYLGDAILGMIVAEYLYLKYPFKEEGFLTEIRARIVNRESLNSLGQKIGLKDLLQKNSKIPPSIYGNCIEALIGAIYLDRGFHYCRNYVIKKLINYHYNLEHIISESTNFKSCLLEWSQKKKENIRFSIIDKEDKVYTAQVFLNDEPMEKGYGLSKKKAEQEAAKKTYEQLKLSE